MEWVVANAEGASCGFLILWDNRVLQLIRIEESSFTLLCRFRNCEDNFTWVFMGVYGPTKREFREDMWGNWVLLKAYGGTLGA